MNWAAISAVGEVLGSVAVFITLGYLAVEVRHAREAVARSSRQSRYDALREAYMMWASCPELANATAKIGISLAIPASRFTELATAAGLSRSEALLVMNSLRVSWTLTEQTIEALGELSPGAQVQAAFNYRETWGKGVGALWYRTLKEYLNPDVVRYVDNVLAQPG